MQMLCLLCQVTCPKFSLHAKISTAVLGSIVGSIGVVAGKMQVRDMFEKIGVTFDSVSTSESSKYYSFLHDYSNGTLQV